jgi:PBP1b-binding outer membrane lipoprotein LpoB
MYKYLNIFGLLAASLLMLGGCSTYTASRPNTSQAQLNADANDCAYQAQQAVAGNANMFIQRDEAISLGVQCMRLRGYTETEN